MIYVVQVIGGGPFKVGYSDSTYHRIKSLQTSSPYHLVVLGQVEGSMEEEQTLHCLLESFHCLSKGEWFYPTDKARKVVWDILGIKVHPPVWHTSIELLGRIESTLRHLGQRKGFRKKRGSGKPFRKGHPKFGGRVKGTPNKPISVDDVMRRIAGEAK